MTGHIAGPAARAMWGFLDQAVSSLINFAVGFLIARHVSDERFGAFSIAFSLYIAFLVTARAAASEPFLIRHSGRDAPRWTTAVGAASGATLLIAVVGSGVMIVVGLVIGGTIGEALIPLAVVLPGLLSLDVMRFVLIARGRPHGALLSDLAWLAILTPTLAIVGEAAGGLVPSILAWGGSALIVVAVAHVITRTAPDPSAALDWWRRHSDIAPRYVAEALISLTSSQATIVIVGILAGLAAAGGLRGAQLLLGPMQVLFIGLGSVAVPEGVALLRQSGPTALVSPAVRMSVGVTASAMMYAILLVLIPDDLGAMLLGETWPNARAVLLPLAIAYAGVTSAIGAAVGLRVLADARTSLTARVIDASAQTSGGAIGALTFGGAGAALGLAVGAWIGSTVTWVSFVSSVRRRAPQRSGGQLPDEVSTSGVDAPALDPGRRDDAS